MANQPWRGAAQTADSRDDWQTPPMFLEGLRQRWEFVADAACSRENAVAPRGFFLEHSSLERDWLPDLGLPTAWNPAPPSYDAALREALASFGLQPERPQAIRLRRAVWCNPPYGRRGDLARTFVARGALQARSVCGPAGIDVVMLMPATTDVAWFHEHVIGGEWPACEILLSRGRIGFINPDDGEARSQNVTGSMLVVWTADRSGSAPVVRGVNKVTGLPPEGWEM